MRLKVVRANSLHSREMAEILNEIIEVGNSTALATKVSTSEIQKWMARNPERSAWHVAEGLDGRALGYQWIEPASYLPNDAAEIATFARIGHTGLGIGSALFRETCNAARRLGYTWINANIRADNTGGLAYYQSRGFEDYGRKENVKMDNGHLVNKVLKRFDL